MKTKTKIQINGLEILASIGVHPHEHETTQPVIIDVELVLDNIALPKMDKLEETLDYGMVAEEIAKICSQAHVQLVETLAKKIGHFLLSDTRVKKAKIKIGKPHALINAESAGCEVVFKR